MSQLSGFLERISFLLLSPVDTHATRRPDKTRAGDPAVAPRLLPTYTREPPSFPTPRLPLLPRSCGVTPSPHLHVRSRGSSLLSCVRFVGERAEWRSRGGSRVGRRCPLRSSPSLSLLAPPLSALPRSAPAGFGCGPGLFSTPATALRVLNSGGHFGPTDPCLASKRSALVLFLPSKVLHEQPTH